MLVDVATALMMVMADDRCIVSALSESACLQVLTNVC